REIRVVHDRDDRRARSSALLLDRAEVVPDAVGARLATQGQDRAREVERVDVRAGAIGDLLTREQQELAAPLEQVAVLVERPQADEVAFAIAVLLDPRGAERLAIAGERLARGPVARRPAGIGRVDVQ